MPTATWIVSPQISPGAKHLRGRPPQTPSGCPCRPASPPGCPACARQTRSSPCPACPAGPNGLPRCRHPPAPPATHKTNLIPHSAQPVKPIATSHRQVVKLSSDSVVPYSTPKTGKLQRQVHLLGQRRLYVLLLHCRFLLQLWAKRKAQPRAHARLALQQPLPR